MELVREIENFKKTDKDLYLALGNFDGVHLGHQKLISELVKKAKGSQGIAAAFIFEPYPTKIINLDYAPKLLLNAERKAELLEKLGLDTLIYNSFSLAISKWSPEEFVERILIARLAVKEVFVGFNYSFGHKGAGTPELLRELGKKHNFGVNIISPVTVDGEIVSSSLVRQALDAGDIKYAFTLLGYYPGAQGIVVEGEHRGGAKMGFPTANLEINPDLQVPATGVYAARVWIDNKSYKAVINIGSKPTFHEVYPVSIEAHLIDFQEDIYGKYIKIDFLQKIRDERKFNSMEALVKQIKIDRDEADNIAAQYC